MTCQIPKFGKIIPWNYRNYKMDTILKNSHFRIWNLIKGMQRIQSFFSWKIIKLWLGRVQVRGIPA